MINKYLTKILSNKYLTIALVIVLGLSLKSCGSMIFNRNSYQETKEEEQGREERRVDSWQIVEYGGMTFKMPDYYEKNESNSEDSLYYYAEKSSKLVYLYISSMDTSGLEGDFSDHYSEVVDGWIETLVEDSHWDNYKEQDSKLIKTDSGLETSQTDYYIQYGGDDQKVPFDCILSIINNKESNKLIVVSLMQSQKADYEYRDEFRKMIDGAKPTVGPSSNNDTSQNTENESTDSANSSSTTDSSAIRPEFKQTMDNYEAWFDHYCEVMKAYKENPSDMNLMIEMTNLLSEEAAMLEEMNKMDQSQMNAAELAYYIEVTARIEKKLLEVAY